MIWFAVAAAATYAAFFLKGAGRSWPFWLLGFGGFLFCFRGPSPLFLMLFAVPTMAMLVESIVHRSSASPRASILMCAASDSALAVAFTLRHAHDFGWDVTRFGGWHTGAAWVLAAAVLRLASPFFVGDALDRGVVSLPWWQGVALAAWVGAPSIAVISLALAAFLMAASLVAPSRSASMFILGSGLILLVGAIHPGGRLLEITLGLAAAAGVAGETTISTWMLAALPLSALALGSIGDVPILLLVSVVWMPGAAALAVSHRDRPRAGGEGLASVATALLLIKLARHPSEWLWFAAAVAASVLAMIWFNRRYPDRHVGAAETSQQQPRHRDKMHLRMPPAMASDPVLWGASIVLLAAAILVARLALIGISTGFLQT